MQTLLIVAYGLARVQAFIYIALLTALPFVLGWLGDRVLYRLSKKYRRER